MDELCRVAKLDVYLSLTSNLNSLTSVKKTKFNKKCYCKEKLETIFNKLDEKTAPNFVNMILERNRRAREVAANDELTYACFECSYSHKWFETNIRTYLFTHPKRHPEISRKI